MFARYLLCLTLVAGCADDPDPGPPRIEATVAYAGTAAGTLVVAAFTSMPPMGPPAAFGQRTAPNFPATVELEGLAAGATAYVLATLDVAPPSPQQPGPEDRVVWSSALTFPTEGATTVSLTLPAP